MTNNEWAQLKAISIVDKYYYPEASIYSELVEDITQALLEARSIEASKILPSDDVIKAKLKEVIGEWRSDKLPEDLIDSHSKCLIGGWNLFKDNVRLNAGAGPVDEGKKYENKRIGT